MNELKDLLNTFGSGDDLSTLDMLEQAKSILALRPNAALTIGILEALPKKDGTLKQEPVNSPGENVMISNGNIMDTLVLCSMLLGQAIISCEKSLQQDPKYLMEAAIAVAALKSAQNAVNLVSGVKTDREHTVERKMKK